MKTDRYTIIVGLNDGDEKVQKFSTDKLEKLMCDVCKCYKVAFSMCRMSGGYFHDNGQFVNENSIQITLIGGSKKVTDEIAKDLCAFCNQESVFVVHDKVDSYLIRESFK